MMRSLQKGGVQFETRILEVSNQGQDEKLRDHLFHINERMGRRQVYTFCR